MSETLGRRAFLELAALTGSLAAGAVNASAAEPPAAGAKMNTPDGAYRYWIYGCGDKPAETAKSANHADGDSSQPVTAAKTVRAGWTRGEGCAPCGPACKPPAGVAWPVNRSSRARGVGRGSAAEAP